MVKNFSHQSHKLKRGQLYWEILKVVGLGLAASSGNMLRPTLPLMLTEIMRLLKENTQIELEEDNVRKSLQHLEKKEIIELVERGDKVFVYLKDTNQPVVAQYSIKALLDFKQKKKQWNGKWFMIFFDVPEIQKNKRNYLRRFLTKIGFYRYQKSVYIFPYECEKEIALIKKVVEGASYIKYIVAERIEDEDMIKQHYLLNDRS